MTTQSVKYHFNPADIKKAIIIVTGACNTAHKVNLAEVWHDYNRTHRMMIATTMVATGELRSKAFIRKYPCSSGTVFIMGYDRTSNNQSEMQEFEGGKVHRTETAHYTWEGAPKCSRFPVDLYAKFGGYTSNPRATKRAMATSIQIAFNTDVRSAVKSGGDLFYRPNFNMYTMRLSNNLARLFKTIGLS
jgi:hypothetical protein